VPNAPGLTAIVTVGDEILSGHTQDTNSSFLARLAFAAGRPVAHIEVVADQLALTGMSLLSRNDPPPARPPSSYAAAAQELSALGVSRAHADPPPLRVRSLRRCRIGRLAYELVKFDHDPSLPSSFEAEQLCGPAVAGAYLCRHKHGRRPWLVWVHGAGQGQPLDLLFSRAGRLRELGFNVALPIQPGHGYRRNDWPHGDGHVKAGMGHGPRGC